MKLGFKESQSKYPKFKLKYIALWLALLCVIVFVLQSFLGSEYFVLVKDTDSTFPWITSPLTLITIVTSIFAHSSIAHLLGNLFSLLLFGLILEGRIGARRTFWLFLISGLVINIFSPYARSLGASGAIFAILGTLVVLRPMMIVWVYSMPLPMFIAGIIWFAIDVFGVFYPSGVGNIAHISGLFIGLIYGALLWKKYSDRKVKNNEHELMV